MNPAEIMAEVASVFAGLPGIRTSFPHPVKRLSATPAAVVGYPDQVVYNALAEGSHRITLPVWIVVGGIVDAATAAKVGRYAGDDDPASVLNAVNDKTNWTTLDQATLTEVSTDVITIGDVDHLTVVCAVDIAVTS